MSEIPPAYLGDGRGAFDPQRAYGRTFEEPKEPPFPEPALRSHRAELDCCPPKSAVTDLSNFARGLGWTVVVTHAKGSFPHATTGRPTAVKDSLAVRMSRGDDRAAAVYVSGATWNWQFIYRWGTTTFPRKLSTLGELHSALS